MRILIFGADGQLGQDLLRVFGPEHDVTGFTYLDTDITDPAVVAARFREHRPEFVINAAAFTDVDGAEDKEAEAFLVNETAAGDVARAAAEAGCPILLYSTDYVFGGTKTTPYEPGDPLAPIGVYARSKAAGEQATAAANPRHYIVRTAWLYGPGGNNFVEKILRAAAARPSLRVVNDEVGSPTHTWDLAQASLALVTGAPFGIYHAVNRGACSRYEFARAILAQAGIEIPIEPCASSEFPAKAVRPLYSVLSNARLEAATGITMRPWQDALKHYMQRRKGPS